MNGAQMGHFGISDKVQFLILSGGYKGNTSNLYICFVHFSVFLVKRKLKQRLSRQRVRMVWTGVVAEDLVRSGLIPDVFSTIGGYRRDRK